MAPISPERGPKKILKKGTGKGFKKKGTENTRKKEKNGKKKPQTGKKGEKPKGQKSQRRNTKEDWEKKEIPKRRYQSPK